MKIGNFDVDKQDIITDFKVTIKTISCYTNSENEVRYFIAGYLSALCNLGIFSADEIKKLGAEYRVVMFNMEGAFK